MRILEPHCSWNVCFACIFTAKMPISCQTPEYSKGVSYIYIYISLYIYIYMYCYFSRGLQQMEVNGGFLFGFLLGTFNLPEKRPVCLAPPERCCGVGIFRYPANPATLLSFPPSPNSAPRRTGLWEGGLVLPTSFPGSLVDRLAVPTTSTVRLTRR